METSIATLLKKFGSKIGLGETLDLGEEGNIRLPCRRKFEIVYPGLHDDSLWP